MRAFLLPCIRKKLPVAGSGGRKKEDEIKMVESNKMKEMPVNKLMVQMGIPMILSMALQNDAGMSIGSPFEDMELVVLEYK